MIFKTNKEPNMSFIVINKTTLSEKLSHIDIKKVEILMMYNQIEGFIESYPSKKTYRSLFGKLKTKSFKEHCKSEDIHFWIYKGCFRDLKDKYDDLMALTQHATDIIYLSHQHLHNINTLTSLTNRYNDLKDTIEPNMALIKEVL